MVTASLDSVPLRVVTANVYFFPDARLYCKQSQNFGNKSRYLVFENYFVLKLYSILQQDYDQEGCYNSNSNPSHIIIFSIGDMLPSCRCRRPLCWRGCLLFPLRDPQLRQTRSTRYQTERSIVRRSTWLFGSVQPHRRAPRALQILNLALPHVFEVSQTKDFQRSS